MMIKRRRLLVALLMSTAVAPAGAESLREALVKAYQTNPTITGARAGQASVCLRRTTSL
jgi:hypothetical protein